MNDSHSVVSDSATPRTIAYQAPLSMGFSRQEYWSGKWLFPSPGDLPDPGIKPRSPALQVNSFTSWATREAYHGPPFNPSCCHTAQRCRCNPNPLQVEPLWPSWYGCSLEAEESEDPMRQPLTVPFVPSQSIWRLWSTSHLLVPGTCSPPPSRGHSSWRPRVSLLVLGKDAHRRFWPSAPDHLRNSQGSLCPAFSPLGILRQLLLSSELSATWPQFPSHTTHPSASAALRESPESLSPSPTKEQPHLHPTCWPLRQLSGGRAGSVPASFGIRRLQGAGRWKVPRILPGLCRDLIYACFYWHKVTQLLPRWP